MNGVREYCNGKNRYDKRGAQTVINKRRREDHERLRMYYCDECGGWHITHKVDMSDPEHRAMVRHKRRSRR